MTRRATPQPGVDRMVSTSWSGRRWSSPAARQGRALARGLEGRLPLQHHHVRDQNSSGSRRRAYFSLALKHGIYRDSGRAQTAMARGYGACPFERNPISSSDWPPSTRSCPRRDGRHRGREDFAKECHESVRLWDGQRPRFESCLGTKMLPTKDRLKHRPQERGARRGMGPCADFHRLLGRQSR